VATQTLEYASSEKICCGFLPADIIICVPSSIVAFPACTESVEDQTFQRSYVEASLTAERCLNVGCNIRYIYTLTVDDTQLITDHTLLTSEIQGLFCKDCLVQYVEDLVGDEPYILTDDEGNQSFISPHGCIYPLATAPSPTWSTWVPVFTPAAPMTFSGVSVPVARYITIGNIVFFNLVATGTTGVGASANINFTLPVAPLGDAISCSALVNDVNRLAGAAQIILATASVDVRKYDSSNYSLGSISLRVSGFYEIA